MGGNNGEVIEDIYGEFGPRQSIQWLNFPDASTRQVGFYHLAVSSVALGFTFPDHFQLHANRKRDSMAIKPL
jgi:hypothetical protein